MNARLTKSEIKATIALLKEHEAAVLTQSSIVCQDGVDDKYADGRVGAIAPMTDGACYIFLRPRNQMHLIGTASIAPRIIRTTTPSSR